MGSRLEQKSTLVRKRIEQHTFDDEQGDEYEGSAFGGFSDYFRRKKIKLQNLDAQRRAQSADNPPIFKGVVCHVNGYTQPSLNDLHTLVVQYGGGFLQYLDGKTMVTHIIAANLTPKKKEEFKRYRIVKPAWIADSVKAGKLLPWDAYRVLDEGVGQKVLGFENGQVVSQANRKVLGYKEQTDTSWYTSQLKAKGEQGLEGVSRQPNLMRTVTEEDEIEEDEFSEPDITSSIERALGGVERERPTVSRRGSSAPEDHIQTRFETIPPTSPPLVSNDVKDKAADDDKTAAAPTENVDQTDLRPREGSQEPDYAMAIIRNSEVLRSVSPSRLAEMTPEEHNALLLSDPRIRKSTVVHPDFLEQYYRESRLHHLSTWKADLKSQLQALAAQKSSSQKYRLKKLPGQRRYIMHVDFDSFFAAVSLKKHPQYIDKPAVVAHGGGSGSEIASCNYPARQYGITNGMWMRRAQQLCPDIKVLQYDFPGYEDASRKFYDAILAIGGVVQSVSIDEALVDISTICIAESGSDGVQRDEGAVFREQSKADTTAQQLRDEIFTKTGCAVSVGIGGNILQAKVALRKAKPAGQYQLKPEDVLDFLGQLEVTKLPGIAWSIGGKLEEIGIKLVRDIRDASKERLIGVLGPKTGERVWEYSRGIDRAEVGDSIVRKSVSAEVNWGVRFENQEQVDEFMQGLCGELHHRLVKEAVKGRQLTMKVMRRARDAPRDPPKHLGHGKCDTVNKSLQLGVATNETAVMAKEAIAMMRSFGITPGELRGIGLQMQKLEPLKARGPAGEDVGSQRRLQFKAGPSTSKVVAARDDTGQKDPIQDDALVAAEKSCVSDGNRASVPVQPVNATTPTKTRLNTLGTQFVLPTQVDPTVLAELPEDIRAKLARYIKPATSPQSPPLPPQEESKQLKRIPTAALASLALPNQSQLDPTILNALSADVRAEILASYTSPPKSARNAGQALLPQSPRKNRILATNKPALKRKRGGGGGGGLFAGRARRAADDSSTLTQSNFVSRPHAKAPLSEDGAAATTDTDAAADSGAGEPDPEFLAALPADLRAEVLAQQRRARLQRTGGIDLSLHQRAGARARRKGAGGDEDAGPAERVFRLPAAPPRIKAGFTARKLTELPDLREAIQAWWREFRDEAPYVEDVAALGTYLREVVGLEGDMGKAVAVVRWMAWVVAQGEEDGREEGVRQAWVSAVESVRESVRQAVEARGLGRVDLD